MFISRLYPVYILFIVWVNAVMNDACLCMFQICCIYLAVFMINMNNLNFKCHCHTGKA